MPNIATIDCTFLHEDKYSNPKTQLDSWRTPGTDGVGMQDQGRDAGEFQFRAVKFGTNDQLQAWEEDLEAIQGTVVTAENDRQVTRTNLAVEGVSPPVRTPAIVPGDTGNHERSEVTITGRVMVV